MKSKGDDLDTMEPDMRPFVTKHRDVRGCRRCSFQRCVTIRVYASDPGVENFAELCDACDLVRRAEVHEQWAVKFRKRANKIFWERQQRKKKGGA